MNYWKALFSPFKPFHFKFYIGKIAMGVPYFLPRKWIREGTTLYAVPRKFGFDYCGLGWKTKWSPTDYRFEWRPTLSFVALGLQIAIEIVAPYEDHYWESWLYYELNTNKNLSRQERIKQCRENAPNIWLHHKDGKEVYVDYYDLILR